MPEVLMEFLRFLESLRTPFLNVFFSIVTYLGSDTVFIICGLFIFWCVNKKWGFRYFVIGLTGSILNQFLKAVFLVPRPWIKDTNFTIVESARAGATGYSFPSGHTQSAVCLFGTLMAWMKNRWISILCIAAILLAAFSRMYLGVHTPLDVGASLITGIGTVALFIWLFDKYDHNRRGKIIIGLAALLFGVLLVLYLYLAPVREANVAQFDTDGKKSACIILGSILGFLVAWWIDDRYMHFDVHALWWAQALKLILGIGLILGVRIGFKPLLNAVLGESALTDGIRYFLMSLTGGVLWPLTFRFWTKLGKGSAKGAGEIPLT